MRKNSGQSLVELIIAISISAIIISSAAGGILMVIRSNEIAGKTQAAASLAIALSDNLISLAESDWSNIYVLSKGIANKYYVATSTGQFVIQSGTEQASVSGFPFSRYFYIENAERDGGGAIGSGTDDPSTQKATVAVSYNISGSERIITESFYLTRWKNEVFNQTDWSGGSGQSGPVAIANSRFDSSNNIDYSSTPGKIFATSGGSCDDDSCDLISSAFDTSSANGAAFNTIMWQGTLPSGATVKFKFSSSDNPGGPFDWAGAPIQSAGPNTQTAIDQSHHNNDRYFKYRAILDKNGSNESPQIENIIVNYSP